MPTVNLKADFPATEAERKSRREEIRRRLAEIEVVKLQIQDIDRELSELDGRLDAAVETHQRSTQPAQGAIAEAVEKIKSLLASREKVPAAVERARRTHLAEVAEANERLTEEKMKIERLRQPLSQERQRLSLQCGELTVLQNALGGQALADQGLYAQQFAASQAEEWASRRLSHASDQANTWRHREHSARERREPENQQIYGRRADRWDAELAAATEALAAAKREAETLRQRVVDE